MNLKKQFHDKKASMLKNSKKIITIDGPAGSGKSTIAKLLARELGFNYIDTGAMYRTITLLALENNLDPEDEIKILKLAQNCRLELENNPADENQYTIVRLNGKDVTNEIRSKEVGAAVSIVSCLSDIRKHLVKLQQELSKHGNAVLEGRDTGSVVCPDATLKVFLTASLQERIKRRDLQNKQKGHLIEKHTIKKEISSRDKIDSSRKDSPLIIPENAVLIDTTNMSIREVADKIKKFYYERI
ncbi:MAG: (d)CMP kinase [Actinobacteria bacterium]|nr:(d)CMP kinase [Actinomycetota bacterium]